jgi:flagellar biosynthesis component FlhA
MKRTSEQLFSTASSLNSFAAALILLGLWWDYPVPAMFGFGLLALSLGYSMAGFLRKRTEKRELVLSRLGSTLASLLARRRNSDR